MLSTSSSAYYSSSEMFSGTSDEGMLADSDECIVYDCNKVPKTLGKRLARGGEGSVYPLSENDDILVKIYHGHDSFNADTNSLRSEKISHMRGMQELVSNPKLAWPRLSIFNRSGICIGYAMRRQGGFPLHTLCQPQLLRERFPGWTRQNIVNVSLKIVRIIKELHRNYVIMGDINPGNILVGADGEVGLIDCDSYQISERGSLYPCPVGVPVFLAPELIGRGDLSKIRRGVVHELFSVAIILFKVLTVGRHPYDRIGGGDPVENLKSGQFALADGACGTFPKGPWFNIWSHLPYRIKELFIRTFRDGHRLIAKRPQMTEWEDSLSIYEREILKGWHSNEIMPAKRKEPKKYSRSCA